MDLVDHPGSLNVVAFINPGPGADRAGLDQMQSEVKAEIEKAVKFAMDAPYPNVDKVEQDVYA